MACHGRCLIAPDTEGVSILDLQGRELKRLKGSHFLPGAGKTYDLSRLPFLTEDGHLLLLDGQSLETATTIPLSGVAAIDPAAMPSLIERGQLSSDGKRLFVPSPDGPGFSILEIRPGGLHPIQTRDPVILISPSGRYGLTVAPDDDSRISLRDYVSGSSVPTSIRFEIDTPFFDADERHLLRRHPIKAGMRLSIYRLSDGEFVSSVAYPAAGGTLFRVGQGKRGVELKEIRGGSGERGD